MARHFNNSTENQYSDVTSAELDFLSALMESEDETYPWNPGDDSSEEYFNQLEAQFGMEDLTDEELSTSCQNFYSQLDALWSQFPTQTAVATCNTATTKVVQLKENLRQTFANRVPKNWLNTIAEKAAEVLDRQKMIGEQLGEQVVQCVQAVLPTLGNEDLSVLTRRYAYAMRSKKNHLVSVLSEQAEVGQKEKQDAVSELSKIGEKNWTDLSEIEQAKVSCAIARYALVELNGIQSQK